MESSSEARSARKGCLSLRKWAVLLLALPATAGLGCALLYLWVKQRPLRRAPTVFDWLYTAGHLVVRPLDGSRLSEGRGFHIPSTLAGKNVIITGSTKGIGFHAAERFHALSANVLVTGRSAATANRAVARVRNFARNAVGRVLGKALDLGNFSAVRSFHAAAVKDFPQLHFLLLNAGTNHKLVIKPDDNQELLSSSGHNRLVAANHLGHFLLTVLLAPHLADGASVVVVGSLAMWMGDPNWMMLHFGTPPKPVSEVPEKQQAARRGERMYEVSKLCNLCFARSLRQKLAKRSVAVHAMTPGLVDTEMNKNNPDFGENRPSAVPPESGGARLFESAFVDRTTEPDFMYPYWFPEAVFRQEAPERRAFEARLHRYPRAKGYRYEGPRGFLFRPERLQQLDYSLHASIGPECDSRRRDALWKWSRKAVGLPAFVDDGDLFQASVGEAPPPQGGKGRGAEAAVPQGGKGRADAVGKGRGGADAEL